MNRPQAESGRSGTALVFDLVLALAWAMLTFPLSQGIAAMLAEAGYAGSCFEGECLFRAMLVLGPLLWLTLSLVLLLGIWKWSRLTRYVAWPLTGFLLLIFLLA